MFFLISFSLKFPLTLNSHLSHLTVELRGLESCPLDKFNLHFLCVNQISLDNHFTLQVSSRNLGVSLRGG